MFIDSSAVFKTVCLNSCLIETKDWTYKDDSFYPNPAKDEFALAKVEWVVEHFVSITNSIELVNSVSHSPSGNIFKINTDIPVGFYFISILVKGMFFNFQKTIKYLSLCCSQINFRKDNFSFLNVINAICIKL